MRAAGAPGPPRHRSPGDQERRPPQLLSPVASPPAQCSMPPSLSLQPREGEEQMALATSRNRLTISTTNSQCPPSPPVTRVECQGPPGEARPPALLTRPGLAAKGGGGNYRIGSRRCLHMLEGNEAGTRAQGDRKIKNLTSGASSGLERS